MAIGPFRFIHAANIQLDVPLNVTEPLSDELQVIAADASMTSFDNVVAACVDRKANFLLLTGNVFVERHKSLRARVALLRAFNRLADHAIPVFVIPGHTDPPEAWRAIPELPRNVTVCYGGDEGPLAVMRDSRVIATVTNGTAMTVADENGIQTGIAPGEASARRPLRIGVLPRPLASSWLDVRTRQPRDEEPEDSRESVGRKIKQYLTDASVDYAVIMGTETRTIIKSGHRIAHSPGKTQENSRFDEPQSGCTVVDVESSGAVRCSSISTGTVGWHAFDVTLDDAADLDDLLHHMGKVSAATRPEPTEQLWLIRWTIRGPAALVESIDDTRTRGQIADRFGREHQHRTKLQFLHTFRLLPTSTVDAEQQPMAADFLTLLRDQLPVEQELLEEIVAGADEAEWLERLETLVPKLDRELIASHATRLGIGWFGNVPGEGHAA